MPSEFIADLVDHKTRVAKYMGIAHNAIMAMSTGAYQLVIDQNSTLLNVIEYIGHVYCTSTTPPVALEQAKFPGQLGMVGQKTLLYFRPARLHYGSNWRRLVTFDLFHRAAVHDHSKFSPEEFELYDLAFPLLKRYGYGTPKYQETLDDIKPAIEHHYAVNDHHPEHFESGIAGMHCNQQLEMCSDWIAASERSQRDIFEGLEINRAKFGIDDGMFCVLKNTIVALKAGAS